jgi:hypothetical protein
MLWGSWGTAPPAVSACMRIISGAKAEGGGPFVQIMILLEGARARAKGEVFAIQSLQVPSQKGRPGKRKACWAAAACRHHCATLFFLLSSSPRWNPRWFPCKGQHREKGTPKFFLDPPGSLITQVNTHRLAVNIVFQCVLPACFQSLSKPRGFFACFNLHSLRSAGLQPPALTVFLSHITPAPGSSLQPPAR